jgi:subtilisin family serine protease
MQDNNDATVIVPAVQSFDTLNASTSGPAGPLDLANITGGGPPVYSPGNKTQSVDSLLWNLDRVDQRALPLNDKYTYGTADTAGTGKGVTIYIVDSGVLITHQEFQKAGAPPGTSRASYGMWPAEPFVK